MNDTKNTTKNVASAQTNIEQFFASLDAGNFESALVATLQDTASRVVDYNKKGKIVIEFDMSRIEGTQQVHIDHTIKFKQPTEHGTRSEEFTKRTPMFVGKGGVLSATQLDMFKQTA